VPLILCGGTASALAAADLGLTTFQPDKISGHRISDLRLKRFIAQFAGQTLEERRSLSGIGRRRAEIILPGALIIEELLLRLGREEYLTSERGLRYGLLLSAV
jgi:exopolyphosphatase/guanosine-5'-triphosphate,3'-diphosphate pyrophosphatase